ncbi:hypothetical protein ACKWTF_002189 [Chironomus riparius]
MLIQNFILLFYLELIPARINLEGVNSVSEPEFANFSVVMSKNKQKDTIMNITINFAYEVSKMMISFSFDVPKDNNDKNFERTIIKSTINVCKMFQGVMGDFIVKTIMDVLHKSVDFELKCPFPKRTFTVTNFLFSDKFLPTYLLVSDFQFMVRAKVMGKVPQHKNLVHLFSTKTVGKITRV